MAKKKTAPNAAATAGIGIAAGIASSGITSRKLTTAVSVSSDTSFSTPATSSFTPTSSSAAGRDAYIEAVVAGLASLSVIDTSTRSGSGVDTPASTITIIGPTKKKNKKKAKKAKKKAKKAAEKEKEIAATEKLAAGEAGQGQGQKQSPEKKKMKKQNQTLEKEEEQKQIPEKEKKQEQEPPVGPGKRASPEMFAVANSFIGPGSLEDWQRLCAFVGLVDKTELTSIKKCKTALKKIWVNIHDIVIAIAEDQPLVTFKSKGQLAAYTFKRKLIFPKEEAKKSRPMKAFMTDFF